MLSDNRPRSDLSSASDPETDELATEAEERHLQIPAHLHRERLDRALVQLLPEFSRNHLKHLIEDGCVVSGAQVQPVLKAAYLVKAAEHLSVRLQPSARKQSQSSSTRRAGRRRSRT